MTSIACDRLQEEYDISGVAGVISAGTYKIKIHPGSLKSESTCTFH